MARIEGECLWQTNDQVVDNIVIATSSDLVSLLSVWDGENEGDRQTISVLDQLKRGEIGFAPAQLELSKIISSGWRPTSLKTEDWLHQFVEQLPLLAMFERGGIAGLNQQLAESLIQLQKQEMTPGIAVKAINTANNLLTQAIYLFPHLVNSVEIKLKPGASEYGDVRFNNWYRQWSELMEAKSKDITEFVMPLSFGFDTGTHGSGQRAAESVSRINVCFGQVKQEIEPFAPLPALMVQLRKPFLSPHVSDMTTFLLEAVESIELSPKGKFSPFIDTTGGYDDHRLVPQANPLAYYLAFREFRKLGVKSRLSEQEPKQNIVISKASNLWELDFRKNKLDRGFVAIAGPDYDQKTVIYEVNEYPFASADFNDEEIAAIVDKITAKKTLPAGASCREYSGREIIERLAQIPVQPREF